MRDVPCNRKSTKPRIVSMINPNSEGDCHAAMIQSAKKLALHSGKPDPFVLRNLDESTGKTNCKQQDPYTPACEKPVEKHEHVILQLVFLELCNQP